MHLFHAAEGADHPVALWWGQEQSGARQLARKADGIGLGVEHITLEIKKWDAAEYLDTDESIAGYLAEVLEGGDQSHIVQALNTVARALGVTLSARA